MAIINSIQGKEIEATNFIMSCMDKINSEADDATLMKISLDYLKSFVETFDENEIVPVLNRTQKVYAAQIHLRPIDLNATKIKNNDDFTNGIRTAEIVEKELPNWPLCFKNPHKIAQMFGSVPTGKKGRKGVSALANTKLMSKINLMNTKEDVLYLIEYFLKFFFISKEKEIFQEYDAFLNKLINVGFIPKDRNNCFVKKTQDDIFSDIVALFLSEDLSIEDNKEFLMKCIDRYYQLYS